MLLILAILPAAAGEFPWLEQVPVRRLAELPTPTGYTRVAVEPGSFAAWLRALPLLPGRPPVHLFDGRLKSNQQAHHAVVQIDVGTRDLQQCADAVMRLRAEYLWAADRRDEIRFNFTSGHPARWRDWRLGRRPLVSGSRVEWQQRAADDDGYANFRAYLDRVFTYAGTASLVGELARVEPATDVRAGDLFIQGGHPGHAVLVLDVAENERGERVFLLGQSYMPAQQFHVLRQPGGEDPWYPARASGGLRTPEWSFDHGDLRRFKNGSGS